MKKEKEKNKNKIKTILFCGVFTVMLGIPFSAMAMEAENEEVTKETQETTNNTYVKIDKKKHKVNISPSVLSRNGWQTYHDGLTFFINGVPQEGFVDTASGKYFLNEDGKLLKNSFFTADDYIYYADSHGVLVTNDEIETEDGIFYAGPDGRILTNFFRETRDGWIYYDENGKKVVSSFVTNNDNTYWFDENGLMASGITVEIDGSMYAFDENGHMMTNVSVQDDDGLYWIGSDGTGTAYEEAYPPGYIPETYDGMSVGYVYDTAYGDRSDWATASQQYKLNRLWEETGSETSPETIMMINGKYLIACKETFGNIGDWITFYFDDGTSIECIMYDQKGNEDNATIWGHIDQSSWSTIKVLEFYMLNPYCGISFMNGSRVCSWVNHGTDPAVPDYCTVWG